MAFDIPNQHHPVLIATLVGAGALLPAAGVTAQEAASSSLLAKPVSASSVAAADAAAGVDPGAPNALTTVTVEPHLLREISMFAVEPSEARIFHEHDLIEIIVRENSAARSKQELQTDKDVGFRGGVSQWPSISLWGLPYGTVIGRGDTDNLPLADVDFRKQFDGEGEYTRSDEFTARLSAEIIEILPNGNLIVESRTVIQNDEEVSTVTVTGICRPEDVTPVNTVLSTQLHDLRIEKTNEGELKKANTKGIFTEILDFLFAF
jgi:flagellar L-ring protein precursor FlgH